jgi:hypothetical protein
MNQVIYKEVQYIRQKYLIYLVVFAALVPLIFFIIAIIFQIGFGIEFGNQPMTNTSLVISGVFSLIFAILLLLFFKTSNLTIEVRTDGFYYKYFPFHIKFHQILKSDVKNVYLRKFSAIGEFGGWGIRFGFGIRGKGYIVSGNTGVQFILNNDKKILFSSENPEKMKIAIEKVFKK